MSVSPRGCRALLGAVGTRAVPVAGYFGTKPPRRDEGCFPGGSGEGESSSLVTSSLSSHWHRAGSANKGWCGTDSFLSDCLTVMGLNIIFLVTAEFRNHSPNY